MTPTDTITYADPERRLRRLFRRLPNRMQATTRWLRKPGSRWARIPAGLSDSGRLPRHPAGLRALDAASRFMLFADDIPPLRRLRDRVLDWLERRGQTGLPRRAARPEPTTPSDLGGQRARKAIDFTPFLTHLSKSAGLEAPIGGIACVR